MLGRGVLSRLHTLTQQETFTLTLYLDIDQNKQSNRNRGYVVQAEALIKDLKARHPEDESLAAAAAQDELACRPGDLDHQFRMTLENLHGVVEAALRETMGSTYRGLGLDDEAVVEDDVVIYAGATILGGDTVVGKGSVVGGNTWVIHSVPPRSRVISTPQEQKIERKRSGARTTR